MNIIDKDTIIDILMNLEQEEMVGFNEYSEMESEFDSYLGELCDLFGPSGTLSTVEGIDHTFLTLPDGSILVDGDTKVELDMYTWGEIRRWVWVD